MVTSQTTEIGAAEMTLTELRCVAQSLEISLDSVRNLKAGLENSLREVEAHYMMQMEQLSGVLLHLESELSQTWAERQHQTQDHKALLNIRSGWRLRSPPVTCWKIGRTSVLVIPWTAATLCRLSRRPQPTGLRTTK